MQLIWCLLSNFYLNMFRASLCPSSGGKECVLLHTVFCTGCDGCGCVELGRELCALWKLLWVTEWRTQGLNTERGWRLFCWPQRSNRLRGSSGLLFTGSGGRNFLKTIKIESNSNFHSAHSSCPSSTQPQSSQPVQNTICTLLFSWWWA